MIGAQLPVCPSYGAKGTGQKSSALATNKHCIYLLPCTDDSPHGTGTGAAPGKVKPKKNKKKKKNIFGNAEMLQYCKSEKFKKERFASGIEYECQLTKENKQLFK